MIHNITFAIWFTAMRAGLPSIFLVSYKEHKYLVYILVLKIRTLKFVNMIILDFEHVHLMIF